MWHWLLHTPAGQWTRIAIGVAIFIVFAIVDLKKKGEHATRWKEYTFVLMAVLVAILYGVLNDQVTSTICWEYFYYGKEIHKVVGPETPPAEWPFRWEVAKVGVAATWSMGLILGVALLIANNPRKKLPQFTYRTLFLCVLGILVFTACSGMVGGWLGYHGFFNNASEDFRDMVRANVFRPQHFLCTWGVHMGDYLGGIVGTILCCVWIQMRRKKLAKSLAT